MLLVGVGGANGVYAPPMERTAVGELRSSRISSASLREWFL